MRNPTCYMKFDAEGNAVVWTLCPGCASEIVVHPQPGPSGAPPLPWYEIVCSFCGRRPRELGYGPVA